MPLVLWRCWLGDMKGIQPVKKLSGVGVVICLERDADLHMAQMMPLPLTVSCFSKIQTGFYRVMLCIHGTSHGPVSVTSRSSTIMAIRRITQTTPHDSAGTLVFLRQITAKFDRSHPLRGRRMQVGWVKIGYFRPIAGYISKTVQDRHIVSIKVE